MKLAILGASGGLGKRLVSNAINRGYEVRALSRHPENVERANEKLTVFKGDAETGEGLDVVVKGCRLVISALGSPKPILTKCMSNLLPHLDNGILERFVFVSWMGVGDSAGQAEQKTGLSALLQGRGRDAMFADIGRAEGVVRMSRLPYVILRPAVLTDGPLTKQVKAVAAQDLAPGKISRADVAWFLVSILEEPGWDRREATLGSAA